MLILPKRHGPCSTSDLFHIEFSFRSDLLLHMKHVDFKLKDGGGKGGEKDAALLLLPDVL